MGDWFGTLFVLCFVFVFLSTNNIATLDYTLDFFYYWRATFLLIKLYLLRLHFKKVSLRKVCLLD